MHACGVEISTANIVRKVVTALGELTFCDTCSLILEGGTMEPMRISVQDAKRRFDAGEVDLLDTRAAEAWQKSSVKIPGAIRVPPDDVLHYLDQVPRNRPIITYCT